ncbi:hypothetical protein CBR_g38424 [Chara braunii]|uniref:Uncharacterized protein n=1 Tax=Chara braunii TaxID=69332 RepID=A0A388JNP5_CHABU|nr:hypothetical protein CBR_g38424 [Chara braunii]|eukprot:GBG59398.1 hypothetical protein CBR_g38424 [Chara braunii]
MKRCRSSAGRTAVAVILNSPDTQSPEKVATLTGDDATPSNVTLEVASTESGEGLKPLLSTEVLLVIGKSFVEVIISASEGLPTAQRPAGAEEAEEEVLIDKEMRANESGLGQPANDIAGAAPSMGEREREGVSPGKLVAQKEVVEAERCADVDRSWGEPQSLSSPTRNTTDVQFLEKVAALTGGDAIPSDTTLEVASTESGEGLKPLSSTEVVAVIGKSFVEVIIYTSVESPTAQHPATAEEADEEVSIDEEVRANESRLGQAANGVQESEK